MRSGPEVPRFVNVRARDGIATGRSSRHRNNEAYLIRQANPAPFSSRGAFPPRRRLRSNGIIGMGNLPGHASKLCALPARASFHPRCRAVPRWRVECREPAWTAPTLMDSFQGIARSLIVRRCLSKWASILTKPAGGQSNARTANSSPPRRATRSISRNTLRSTSAAFFRARSPSE